MRIFRGLVAGLAGVLLSAGASVVLNPPPASADVVACIAIGVTIPNTPVQLRQHPCVPLGLDTVPPNPSILLANPALPVAESQQGSLDVCGELKIDAPPVPGLDEAQCQSVPLAAAPPGAVPPLPQVPFPPPIPPPLPTSIPPHIPGVPPLPIPSIPVPALPLPV